MGKLEEFGKKHGTKPSVVKASTPENGNGILLVPTVLVDESTQPSEKTFKDFSISKLSSSEVFSQMSWLKIDKIVIEQTSALLDNLSIIYTALHETAETVVVVLNKENDGFIRMYLGVRDKMDFKNHVSKYLLQRGLFGCLPGISYSEGTFHFNLSEPTFISCTTGIPSLKNDKKEGFIQGIERLINSTSSIPSFTIILLAKNKDSKSIANERNNILEEYGQLSGMAEKTTTITENTGTQESTTDTSGTSETTTDGTSTSEIKKNITETESTTTSEGNNVAFVAGVNSSESKTKGKSEVKEGKTETSTNSTAKGSTQSKGITKGKNSSAGKSIQIKEEDKAIKEKLKKLDKKIERTYNSESLGTWDFSTYFLADTQTTSYILACIYKGLVCGMNSNIDNFTTHRWNEKESSEVFSYLQQFRHPVFYYQTKKITPTVEIDSFELSIGMSLPMTSVPGILVKEQASFGRSVIRSYPKPDSSIEIGSMSHLGIIEDSNRVELDENMLTSHVFVTGTTGCGKSNTIFSILSRLKEHDKRFLIIEPAKGEYKNVLGGFDDVRVLGTNPQLTEQIKINPFSFPSGIHVEEHIDRLIDIFNACWPMYAAMPAVLKESICRAYESCGWDLIRSKSNYEVFPTFDDVRRELNQYVNESEYSSDSKGDYKGALGTRLESLTNGIIGQIFTGKALADEELFNQNVIIDLSKVGSVETKSLIMGLLIIKLNEFRMSENVGMNLPLRHITVLEEAHNLLRETSGAQSQEGANVAGKSVEMLASAIAEMRTYGECFVIADQSPSLLDRAAISNTNTKIVMNLPNRTDREIVANSIGLSDQQMNELSKLKTGIAVVYQKGWEESVQCLIDRYDETKPYSYNLTDQSNEYEKSFIGKLYSGYTDIPRFDSLVDNLQSIGLSGYRIIRIMNLLNNDEIGADELCARIFVIYVGESLFIRASKADNIDAFNFIIEQGLEKIEGIDRNNVQTFLNMYIKGCSIMNKTSFYENWLKQIVELKNRK